MRDSDYNSSMITDSQINQQERQCIDVAIEALRTLAHNHGMHSEHYDEQWMDMLDKMIKNLRTRDADCLRLQRHLGELAVPEWIN